MKLEQLLRKLSPSIVYTVLLSTPLHDAMSLEYTNVENIKEYLHYEVISIEPDFTIIIRGKRIA